MAHAASGVTVGVVGADPLRLLGLQSILEENAEVTVRAVTLGEPDKLCAAAALMVDASAVADVTGVLADLRGENPALPVIVLGESTQPEHIQAMIAAGAKGYLPGTATESEVRMAVAVVLDGSVWAPRKVLAKLLDAGGVKVGAGTDAPRVMRLLTRRENEVLQLLLAGHTNRGIAESLGVDQVTVKAHLGRMFRKAGVKNRVELTSMAHGQAAQTS